MVKGVAVASKLDRFAPTPWSKESEEWLALDRRLAADHLARRVAEAVEMLDLKPLLDSYLGAGKKALRPDLLLKMVIYEMQNNRPSPAQWARDVYESEPVRWLLFGMEPSRARLYDFRDRIAPFLAAWNAQVLSVAVVDKMTMATSVEARVPFLDHHLVEYAMGISVDRKINGHNGKIILKRALEKILPAEVLYSRKRGFGAPIREWFRGATGKRLSDRLLNSPMRSRNFLDYTFVARLLEGEEMTALCREFAISRKTGYKIFDRYKECGL